MHLFEGKILVDKKIESSLFIENIYLDYSKTIYEVIRVIDGIPLFLDEHLKRFYFSCEQKKIQVADNPDDILKKIYEVISINTFMNKNIKVQISETKQNNLLVIGFISSHYIDEPLKSKGVHTILYKANRENPNVKQQDSLLRSMINQALQTHQAAEALLVNDCNQITEGSRSNVFFVKEKEIFTPPSKMVLKGITREKVFSICSQNNLKLMTTPISVEKICEFEAAFLTGTSIDVLPIASINEYLFPSSIHDSVCIIQKTYQDWKDDYLEKHKPINKK